MMGCPGCRQSVLSSSADVCALCSRRLDRTLESTARLYPINLPGGTYLTRSSLMIETFLNREPDRIVYRATDRALNRTVVVEEWFPEGSTRGPDGSVRPDESLSSTKGSRTAFKDLVIRLAQRGGHHVPIIFDLEDGPDHLYMVRQYVRGSTLARHLQTLVPGSSLWRKWIRRFRRIQEQLFEVVLLTVRPDVASVILTPEGRLVFLPCCFLKTGVSTRGPTSDETLDESWFIRDHGVHPCS